MINVTSMHRSILLITFLSLSICASTHAEMKINETAALATALQNGDRTEAEKLRDQGRKPAEVLATLGIDQGMSVLDVIAAGGYYTEVLSYAVGPSGTVYAQNPDFVLKFRDGANDKALSARLAKQRLANVIRLDSEVSNLDIKANSLDAAITALNFHDIYNRSPEAALELLKSIKGLLRSGGVFGVIDHNGNVGADNGKLHRMPVSDAIAVAKQAGFTVESSELLANSEDDRTQAVFAGGRRGKTDRFLLKLVKP